MSFATAVRVTAMRPEHADQILAIYQLGIDEGSAIFETTAPTWEAFDATKLPEHRLILQPHVGVVASALVVAVSGSGLAASAEA